MSAWTRMLLAGCGLVALSACAPDLAKIAAPRPVADYATAKSFAAPAAAWPADDWWTAYADPELNALVAEALKDGPSYRQALARARIAAGLAQQAQGPLGPSLSVDANVVETRQSKNLGFPPLFKSFLPGGFKPEARAAIGADYPLDVLGKYHDLAASAGLEAEAAQADAAAARLTLAAGVVRTYADLARLSADRDLAEKAIEVRQKTLELVRQRHANGLETEGEVSQQAANVPAAQAELDRIDRDIAITRHALAALLGKGPDRGLDIPRPKTASLTPLGLPDHLAADLIARRADVTAARWRATAAAKRVHAAWADFYPNINLTASYGGQSLGLDTFFRHDSQIGTYGPALHIPLFPGPREQGAYGEAKGEYAAAVATYDGALATALRDVADAVSRVRSLQVELAHAREALAHDEDAYRVMQARYAGGLAPYLNVLSSENTVLAQRRAVADLEGQAAALNVNLVQALGGGYRAPSAPR
jgi:NodT family efflux transporter outer membrane factor (OMF) lipoprotein